MMKMHANDTDSHLRAHDVWGHRIESLRNIVQRFLQQFDGAQDEESRKVHALLKENAVGLWDLKNFETTQTRDHYGEVIYTVNRGWTFHFWNGNLIYVSCEKSIGAEPNEMLTISIGIRNEEERWYMQAPTRGDNVNAGVYFIENWNITISKNGRRVFHVDRDAYWKHRVLPLPSDLKKVLRNQKKKELKSKKF